MIEKKDIIELNKWLGDDYNRENEVERLMDIEIPDGWFMAGDKLYPSEYTAHKAVQVLLQYIGEDPARDGLKDTPARVCKALREMTKGYNESPEKILSKTFSVDHDELVVLRDISFTSLCEHHMLPFTGVAHVAYVPHPGFDQGTFTKEVTHPPGQPQRQVVGLSKMARLVHCYARRLQVQERLTGQIADAMVKFLKPLGAACIIKAEHSCMSCRGVNLSNTNFITSALRGVLKDDPRARSELMSLCS